MAPDGLSLQRTAVPLLLLSIFCSLISVAVADGSCSMPWDNCMSSRCCQTPGHRCYAKDTYWGSCLPENTCRPGVHPEDPAEYQQAWSCELLEPVPFMPSQVPVSFVAPRGSPVEMHGHIRVEGNRLVGSHGEPVRLKGMSLYWSQWGSKFWNDETIQWLVQDWQVTLVRAAMGVEAGGYLQSGNIEKQRVVTVVDAAIRNGVYVIIDWHDHHAATHQEDALAFFAEMAEMYGKFPNVFFEIYNEPLTEDWSSQTKPYEQAALSTIRNHTDNLVICGTPNWSQDVEKAAQDPIVGHNIAYTLHFYATSHKELLRAKAQVALNQGAAIFASEWGTCSADGDGTVNLEETRTWLEFLEENGISDANWALNDKSEACSALLPGSSASGWSEENLTQSGAFVRAALRGELPHFHQPGSGQPGVPHFGNGDLIAPPQIQPAQPADSGSATSTTTVLVVPAETTRRLEAAGNAAFRGSVSGEERLLATADDANVLANFASGRCGSNLKLLAVVSASFAWYFSRTGMTN